MMDSVHDVRCIVERTERQGMARAQALALGFGFGFGFGRADDDLLLERAGPA